MSEKRTIALCIQEFYSVESDMCSSSFAFEDYESVEKITAVLFENAPLIGELVFPEELIDEFVQKSKMIIQRLDTVSTPIMSLLDKQILFATAVMLTQEFDLNDDESKLWEYILTALGKEQSGQVVENNFRKVLKDVAAEKSRYFAQSGQKYYNTLNAHALTPSWSIEHLFNIVYSFYEKNLQSFYSEQDVAFLLLAKNIKSRWSVVPDTEELKLRSDALASSTRMLFVQNPHYMAAVCDSLTKKMDSLLKGETGELDLSNRWDCLLKTWYEKKTTAELKEMQDRQKRAGKERVVTKKEDIRATYFFENEDICLRVPRIRLPELSERPMITVVQNGQTIFTKPLRVFGDDLCLTSYECEIPLDSLDEMDWSQNFKLGVSITADNQTLYDSKDSLYRQYFLFNASGMELSSVKNNQNEIYLIAGEQAEVIVNSFDEDNNSYSFGDKGTRYYVDLYSLYELIVSGRDLLSETQDKSKPFFYCSQKSIQTVTAVNKDNREFQVFDKPVSVKMVLPDDRTTKNYYAIHDAETKPLYEYQNEEREALIPLSTASKQYHSFEVREFFGGTVVYSLDYVILPHFKLEFDRALFPNIESFGRAIVSVDGDKREISFTLEEGQKTIDFEIWGNIGCRAIIPKLEVVISGQNAFYYPNKTWHENILTGDYLTLNCPDNYVGAVSMGTSLIPEVKKGRVFELGNYIHSRSNWNTKELDLGVIIRDKESKLVTDEFITTIVFEESFIASPIIVEDRSIIWSPGHVYIGSNESEFKVFLENDREEPWEYSEDLKMDYLETEFPCQDGAYNYQVFLVENNLFQNNQDKLLLEGKLTIGNPNVPRFNGKEIRLRKIHYWSPNSGKDEQVLIRDGDAVICRLFYVGNSEAPNGEESPCYSGSLGFYKKNGELFYFNNNKFSSDYELVNPVKVWIIGEKRLIIETKAEESVRFEFKTNHSLRARLINTKYEESGKTKYQKYHVADEFEFEIVPENSFGGTNESV